MFNLGLTEIILLAGIALLVIGPKQLPEMARTVARFINEFRRTANEFTKPITDVKSDIANMKEDATQAVKDAASRFVELPDDEDDDGVATHVYDPTQEEAREKRKAAEAAKAPAQTIEQGKPEGSGDEQS